ncbi:hypothetical protein MHLP_04035 [Candidatus Mycoplasma haematolamae str. Purdue]|uniref:Uncharacterized protein n=1 Tax=Mycoplasma haematolamae (strain Purdue) TaxID=1212765 RepID=I7C748_MYCHA|nr:hypothetical protein [Candidatus Mycoplasma haematolamae]AFO52387.1 hypothetical protein MHLP_04035 [Candidatus Mycoplasma haematolamae str. Purdue]
MFSALKPIACAFIGTGSLIGGTFGTFKVVSEVQRPKYSVGQKYCLSKKHNVCIYFGRSGESFRSDDGIWVDPGTASAVTAIQTADWLNVSDIEKEVKELFKEHPGLEAFTKGKISEYEKRVCKYHAEEETVSSGKKALWYKLECPK